ncbi:nucleolar protein 16 isoform X2 [Oryzias melastigma]|uniref:Nucleolar protein 16 n=1 Tax=Oryzias melastigma TaxID=30732 RepID=A0A3B3CTF7_ORYME|nr:nucleolar protein 16 isoform X1 [Oryzias melastigma]XP_024120441.1 nucleolar protein 16 isoform X2 [Oryzias melastigma]
MPKAKQSKRRKKFDYNKNRKKLKRKFQKKSRPWIEDSHIRNAWDDSKSTASNLLEMGLSSDPNRTLPVKKTKSAAQRSRIITKPYILNQLEEEASLPEKDCKTLSSDLMEYVQYMIRQHKDDYKAMARDDKNYYQDTPKQIKRKINEYKRCHPQLFQAFVDSLGAPEPMLL